MLHLRMKSSCNVRMCPRNPPPRSSAPSCKHPPVQHWQLELRWAGTLPSRCLSSLDGIEFSYIYHFAKSITSSHRPGLACITRSILDSWIAAKEILLFCLQNLSLYITHRGGGPQLLPSISQKARKNIETCCFSACRDTSKQHLLEPQAQIAICFRSNNHSTSCHYSLSYAGSFL